MSEKSVKITCSGASTAEYTSIKPLQGSLKKLSNANYEKLKKEIVELGFSEPISVWKAPDALYALNGHQRLTTLGKMEKEGFYIPQVPINWIEANDTKEAKKKILALTSQYGEMTQDGLFEFMKAADLTLKEIREDFRFPEVDFGKFEREFFEEQIEEDEIPEPPENPVTQLGDTWILGDHVLRCGDSREEMLAKNTPEIPFMMVTDPPYGVNYDPEWRPEWRKDAGLNDSDRMGKVKNDDIIDWTDTYRFFMGDVAYVWHASYFTSHVHKSLIDLDFKIRANIIWKKPRFALSQGHYHWQHEPCWYAVRNGKPARWNGDRSQSTIWDIAPKEDTQTIHGTQKPVECMARPIRNHGKEGDLIYDPFGGSGTTLIAATHLNRKCYMIELDPKYCDVIIERWEKLTGGKAKRA